MKICYLAPSNSVHTKRWAESFANKGNEVYVISIENQEIPIENVKILHFTINWIFFPISFIKILFLIQKKILEIKPDIIHAHYVTKYGFIAALLNKHPFILSPWGSDITIGPEKSVFYYYIAKYSIFQSDCIVTGSKHLSDYIHQKFLTPFSKLHVCFWGINPSIFRPEQMKPDFYDELSQPDSIFIICTRWLSPVYDIETVILAMNELSDKYPNLKCIIGGSGHLYFDIMKKIKKMGLHEKIFLINGIPNNEMPKFLANSDIYVDPLPSSSGVSVSLLEAMACGCFPIVANIPGVSEVIEHGRNGLIFEGKNYLQLSRLISRAIDDIDLRFNAKEYNLNLVSTKFNWLNIVDEIEKIYESNTIAWGA